MWPLHSCSVPSRKIYTLVLGAGLFLASSARAVPAEWQGLSLPQFADLAVKITCSPEVQKAKKLPTDFVDFTWATYLNDPKQVETADPPTLFRLLSAIDTGLTKERRQAFAENYYKRFQRNDRQTARTPDEMVLAGWVLVNSTLGTEGKEFPELREAVLPHIIQNESFAADIAALQQQVKSNKDGLSAAMTNYLNPFWQAEIRKTLDDTACAFYRGLLSDSALSRDYSGAYFCAVPFESDSSRKVLVAQLEESDHSPRLGVAKVLTWSFRRANRLNEWAKQLDSRLADPKLAGDAKAKWLVVRALAEEARPAFPDPMLGHKYLDKAMEVASSEHLGILVVHSLVERTMFDGGFAQASSLVESVAGRFRSDEGTTAIASMRLEIDAAKRQYSEDHVRQVKEQELGHLVAYADSLRTRLKSAQASGASADKVAALQQSLQRVESQLAQARGE